MLSYREFCEKYKHLKDSSYLTSDRCGEVVAIEVYYHACTIMRVYAEKLSKLENNKTNIICQD